MTSELNETSPNNEVPEQEKTEAHWKDKNSEGKLNDILFGVQSVATVIFVAFSFLNLEMLYGTDRLVLIAFTSFGNENLRVTGNGSLVVLGSEKHWLCLEVSLYSVIQAA